MATMTTDTVRVSIDAPPDVVIADLASPHSHPEWATDFFNGPATEIDDDVYQVQVPRMGGPARMKIEVAPEAGNIDLYLAPQGAPFGPPLPVRVVPNGGGCDVLFTLARTPRMTDDEWRGGLESMQRELGQLKLRHEGAA